MGAVTSVSLSSTTAYQCDQSDVLESGIVLARVKSWTHCCFNWLHDRLIEGRYRICLKSFPSTSLTFGAHRFVCEPIAVLLGLQRDLDPVQRRPSRCGNRWLCCSTFFHLDHVHHPLRRSANWCLCFPGVASVFKLPSQSLFWASPCSCAASILSRASSSAFKLTLCFPATLGRSQVAAASAAPRWITQLGPAGPTACPQPSTG